MNKPWHWIIKDDKSKIIEMIEFFNKEIEEARREVKKIGIIEKIAQEIPGWHETRLSQLQELEAVLEMLEIEMRQIQAEKFKYFLEGYRRALSSSDCKKYVEGDKDVCELAELINEVSYIRNTYSSIVKSLEMKAFQLNNIVRLRASGIEDARLE
ncbi:recombination mediator protein UvsY [Escherichia coli]